MDFSFTEEQTLLGQLTREILEKEVTAEKLKAVEATAERFDAALWAKLADANLLGAAIPEEQGGMGFGLCELGMLLHELGRAVAPVPALSCLVLGALPIARFGSDEQRSRWLEPLARGELLLTAALSDVDAADAASPATHARPIAGDGGGGRESRGAWLLEGHKTYVPNAGRAVRIVVPAATGRGTGLFLVDPKAEGVSLELHPTRVGEPLYSLTLSGVRVEDADLLDGDATDSGAKLEWLYECGVIATCLLQAGVSERALEITADYAREREQFGVPIGSFQAVQHRCADAYIDLEALRWCAWRAAWVLSNGELARRETAVAKFWAAEGGSRIANTAQHIHAGLGVDVDYPIHRHFLWSKSLELTLGSSARHLARLGRDMARTGPQELV